MKKIQTRRQRRKVRSIRVRSRVQGTKSRPRLSVFRSGSGIYLQLIDDDACKTLVGVRSGKRTATATSSGERSRKVEYAYQLGKMLAEKAKTIGITTVVFDRAGYAYHGRVKAAAEGARDGGLVF